MKIFIACSKHFYSEIEKIVSVLEGFGHECYFTDELIGINPIVINGDLNLIK